MKRITDLLQFLLAGGDWKLPSDEARDRLLNDDVGHNIIGRRVQRDAGLGVVHLNSGHAVLLSMAFWVCMAQTVWTKNAGDKKYGKPPRFSHIFCSRIFLSSTPFLHPVGEPLSRAVIFRKQYDRVVH